MFFVRNDVFLRRGRFLCISVQTTRPNYRFILSDPPTTSGLSGTQTVPMAPQNDPYQTLTASDSDEEDEDFLIDPQDNLVVAGHVHGEENTLLVYRAFWGFLVTLWMRGQDERVPTGSKVLTVTSKEPSRPSCRGRNFTWLELELGNGRCHYCGYCRGAVELLNLAWGVGCGRLNLDM